MSIAKHASNGGAWVGLSTLIKGLVQVVQLIILARVLSPLELGIVAVINLVVGFAQVFGDAGLSNALIYHKDLSQNQKSQLFVVNICLGAALSISVALLSPFIAWFFELPQLTTLLLYLAPVFFIRSLGQQIQALLQQAMAFKRLAKIEVFAQLFGFCMLLSALWFGLKESAVVVAQLSVALALSFSFMLITEYRPRLTRVHYQQVIEPIRYGLYQTGESLVNYMSAQIDQLLVGKLLGAETLGIYAYIKDLVFKPALQLINPIVNKVAFPLMVNFGDERNRKALYMSMLALLTLINAPLYIFAAEHAEVLITLVYGSSWLEHAQLLKWMAYYMLLISIVNPVGVLLRSTGNVKRAFWWNVFVSIVRPLIVVACISGGVVFLAQALTLLQFTFVVLHVIFLIKPLISLQAADFFRTIAPATICAFTLSYLSNYVYAPRGLWETTINLFICTGLYLLLMAPIIKNLIKELRGHQ